MVPAVIAAADNFSLVNQFTLIPIVLTTFIHF